MENQSHIIMTILDSAEILKESSARKIADFTKTDSVYKTGYGRNSCF